MKKFYKVGAIFGLGLMLLSGIVNAQGTQYPFWNPVKGDANNNGLATAVVTTGDAATHTPGSRFNMSFTNVNSTLYMFAGQRGSTTSELWTFDPTTYIWTKLTYTGTGPNNRHSHAAVAHGDDLYVFGGSSITNDLYKLNTLTKVWTRLRTSTGATAVTTGDAATHTPGGKQAAAIWQVDGIIYLFGGRFNTTNPHQNRNDFWKYDIATDRWTLLGGTQTTNDGGTYGTKGTSASGNIPTSRNCAVAWTVGRKLYLFGGNTTPSGSNVKINDLWVYDIDSGEWTWLTGSNTTNATAVYGTTGSFAATNTPGAVSEAFGWTAGGKLYLYGGGGYNDSSSGSLSDLWEFDPAQGADGGQWRLLKGTKAVNSVGNSGSLDDYGTRDYYPRGRGAGSAVALGNKFFLYGGYVSSSNAYNDVWLVDLDVTEQVLPVNFISFAAKATTLGVQLNWQVTSEANHKQYVVSRSTNGTDYIVVATTTGYSTKDNNIAPGTYYYKLEQQDKDGKVNYLATQVVKVGLSENTLLAYPNPTKSSATVAIVAGQYNQYNVVNLQGATVLKSSIASISTQVNIDLSSLSAGSYIIKLTGTNGNTATRIIKL